MAAEMIIDWINIMKKNRAPAARDEETNSHTPRYCIDNEESHFPLLKFLKKSYFLYLSPHLGFKKILERIFDQNPTPNPQPPTHFQNHFENGLGVGGWGFKMFGMVVWGS